MRGLWTDIRIEGYPRTVHGDSDDLMQLPEEVRKLVCFIHGGGGGKRWVGTGFFVADPLGIRDEKGDELSAIYIVTARHCVQQIDPAEDPPVETIDIRLNTVDGGSDVISTDVDRWVHHETSDVSVYALAPGRDKYDYLYYPIRLAHGPIYQTQKEPPDPVPEQNRIGPGADVFLTGLLFYHPGETRIMPIIRVGNIAAYPEDPVNLKTGSDHVYLIESRSLGGLSGSPVFIHFPPWRYDSQWRGVMIKPPLIPGNAGPNYMIGLVHGYYPTTGNDPDGLADASREPLNTGISVVVPLQRAIDLIDSPDLKAQREEIKESLRKRTMPTPAVGASPDSDSIDNTAGLMGKLLKVPKEEADEVHRSHE